MYYFFLAALREDPMAMCVFTSVAIGKGIDFENEMEH